MHDDQLSMKQIDVLLSAAVAAPSMHNTQPLRLEVNGRAMDRAADQLTAGLALQHVLLTATREGFKASFLNQPLEFDDLRCAVQRATGIPGFAQMVTRFGYSTVKATTPRRPVETFVR
ncbi:nitroreductase family protein [Kribbella qitaiheensis]|nr:nitroreductase family protein [Kribbella qitaiheensis]